MIHCNECQQQYVAETLKKDKALITKHKSAIKECQHTYMTTVTALRGR